MKLHEDITATLSPAETRMLAYELRSSRAAADILGIDDAPDLDRFLTQQVIVACGAIRENSTMDSMPAKTGRVAADAMNQCRENLNRYTDQELSDTADLLRQAMSDVPSEVTTDVGVVLYAKARIVSHIIRDVLKPQTA